jgi:putative phage-type endonuclease
LKQILDKRSMSAEDWQVYRRTQKGIGGSDCAVILGLNPWKTPFTLWLEMTGQITPSDLSGNESVEWGNLLEPVIREKFARETGFEVRENHFVLQHDHYNFMVANVDGEVLDPVTGEWGLLEIKTASDYYKSEWQEGPPNHYHLQIQHYLAVMDYNFAYVAVLLGGNQFRYFKILRDDYVIDLIISAEKSFWEMVQTKTPPPISGKTADTNFLAAAYPEASEEEGLLSDELFGLSLRYTELQKEIKSLQEEADTIKNRVKLEAKDFKVLKNEMVKISMPTVNKISFDTKKFAAENPDLYEKYKTKESSYRNFTISVRRE